MFTLSRMTSGGGSGWGPPLSFAKEGWGWLRKGRSGWLVAANRSGMWICHPCLDAPIYRQLGTASRARQPRNPPAHGSAVLLVGTPKFPCQGRFFVKEDEQMNEKEEWQSQEQNRNRMLVETEPDEENQAPDIHRVANVLVGADGDECSRGIKNGGCSSSSGNENARARKHENCSDDRQDSAGDFGRSR